MIVDAVDKLPLDAGVRERGEAFLLDEATRLNATDLAKAARHLVEVADPEEAERKAERDLDRDDRAAHHGRFLSIVEDGAGGVRLRGRGTVEDAAVLKAALLPLTKPQPAARPAPTPTAGRPPTRATTAPGCGTPWSRPPSTPWPPTCPPTATAPDPASRSPPASTCSSSKIDWATLGSATSVDRGRPRAQPRHGPPAGLRRRHHPHRPRHQRRGPRRRPHPPTGHPGDLAGPGLPRPALRLPRLHQTPGHVPRPPHHPLGRRRRHQPGQHGPALRPPPPRHPPHPLAGPDQPRRRHDPSSSPPQDRPPTPGLDQADPGARVRNSQERTTHPSQTAEDECPAAGAAAPAQRGAA